MTFSPVEKWKKIKWEMVFHLYGLRIICERGLIQKENLYLQVYFLRTLITAPSSLAVAGQSS